MATHDEGKGWTHTGAGRYWPSYDAMYEKYIASGKAKPAEPEIEAETEADDAKAKELYNKHTDNHPTIHSNRFPSWEELRESDKEEWRKQAAALCVDEGCDHHGTDHVCVTTPPVAEPVGVVRKNGIPIDGRLAYKAGFLVSDCPYSSTSSQDYDNHSRWTDEWSRAAMDDNHEADN